MSLRPPATWREPAAGSAGAWGAREAFALVVGVHLVLIVVGSLVVAGGGWEQPYPIAASFWAGVPFWIAASGGAWWLARRSGGSPSTELGLAVRPVDVPLGIAVGVVMQLVVVPLVYWPLLRVLGTDADEVERLARELADSARGASGVAMFLVMTCVMAPVVEEVLYRGVLQRGVGRRDALAGVAVAALVFGIAHFQPLQFVGLALFGAVAGLLALSTGRLGPAVIAHVAFNATTAIPLIWRR